jgi:hypothetical protein
MRICRYSKVGDLNITGSNWRIDAQVAGWKILRAAQNGWILHLRTERRNQESKWSKFSQTIFIYPGNREWPNFAFDWRQTLKLL